MPEIDSPTRLPALETERVLVRPFRLDDLDAIHRILDVELADADFGSPSQTSREERERWLRWSVLNYDELALLYQPPYGDRAIVSKESGALVGACGFVPSLGPFDQLDGMASSRPSEPARMRPEVGLYYAVSPAQQRRGYATEAMTAMIEWAFRTLDLARIVATTTHANSASIGVMRKLGMSIHRNPLPEPPWFQVVGMLAAPPRSRS